MAGPGLKRRKTASGEDGHPVLPRCRSISKPRVVTDAWSNPVNRNCSSFLLPALSDTEATPLRLEMF